MSSTPGSDGGNTLEPEDKQARPTAEPVKPQDGTPEEQDTQKKARWRKLAKAALSWAFRTAVTWLISEVWPGDN
ncbi:hypothetical protein [Lentzea sp. NPDC051838]|uniref:hypothetical protein n=1 Tax=Lentzea sp. NPDC051838 TaxID=3154849 RepID=UPI00343AD9A1